MTHPLETILEWFKSLHPPDKNWAALKFVSALPSENKDLPFEALADGERLFENWLSVRGFYTQDLGRVVATRALISFVLVREAVQESYWRELREGQEVLLRHLEESGDEAMAKKMRDRLLDLPRLEASWREAASQWRKLNEEELSDSALSQWCRSEESKDLNRTEKDPTRSGSDQKRR
jgi:hypothetical protein